MKNKITIVGAGNVGASTAQILLHKNLGDVVLVDIVEGLPQGKALDLMESRPIEGFRSRIIGTNSYEETKNSDVVVITAGIARKPGMSRDDLLETNVKIVKSVTEQVVKYSPECILIVVTNPVNAMVYAAYKASKFPKNRIIGSAGILDTSRFKAFISEELNIEPSKIDTMVIGIHGNEMVPLLSHSKVDGKPLNELLDMKKISTLAERTRKGGDEIVQLLKTGSAFYAPGSSIAELVKCILNDEKRVLPCATYLEGEYGVNGIFAGVPAILGRKGVKEIIELKLSEEESGQFERAVEHIKQISKKVDSLMV